MQNISTKSGNYQTTKLQIVEKTEISKKMTLFYIIQAKASIPVRPSNSDSMVGDIRLCQYGQEMILKQFLDF